MKRRTVLAGLGAALLSGGCLSSSGSRSSPTNGGKRDGLGERPPDDDTPSDSPGSKPGTPDDPITEQPNGPFPDLGCPSFRESDVTVCAHTDDHPIPIMLRPNSPTFRVVQGNDTVETLGLTLSNASGHSFGFNPYDWRVDRYTGEGWTKVAPEVVVEPWTEVPPDGHYEYELTTREHHSSSGGPHQIVADLTNGIHAVSVVGNWGEGGRVDRVECVALVDVIVESVDDSQQSSHQSTEMAR